MQKNKNLANLILAALAAFYVGNVHASSSFTNYATVNFTIDNIVNLTNPGSVLASELGIYGSFEQSDVNDVVDDSKSVFQSVSLTSGSSFNHTFTLTNTVNDGYTESYQIGYFGFGLVNGFDSGSIYQIDFNFNYLLSAFGGGESADTEIYFDYYSDEDFTFSGFDYVNHSSIFGIPAVTANDSGSFSIVLDPGVGAFYVAQAVITGNLYASPVPVPGAAWLFMSGLLTVFGFKKRKMIMH